MVHNSLYKYLISDSVSKEGLLEIMIDSLAEMKLHSNRSIGETIARTVAELRPEYKEEIYKLLNGGQI